MYCLRQCVLWSCVGIGLLCSIYLVLTHYHLSLDLIVLNTPLNVILVTIYAVSLNPESLVPVYFRTLKCYTDVVLIGCIACRSRSMWPIVTKCSIVCESICASAALGYAMCEIFNLRVQYFTISP